MGMAVVMVSGRTSDIAGISRGRDRCESYVRYCAYWTLMKVEGKLALSVNLLDGRGYVPR